jgi:hypothetical protein
MARGGPPPAVMGAVAPALGDGASGTRRHQLLTAANSGGAHCHHLACNPPYSTLTGLLRDKDDVLAAQYRIAGGG